MEEKYDKKDGFNFDFSIILYLLLFFIFSWSGELIYYIFNPNSDLSGIRGSVIDIFRYVGGPLIGGLILYLFQSSMSIKRLRNFLSNKLIGKRSGIRWGMILQFLIICIFLFLTILAISFILVCNENSLGKNDDGTSVENSYADELSY